MDKPALLDSECVPVLLKQGPERRETFISVRTGQYKNGGERGLKFSLCCLCQDQLVEHQIRHGLAQSLIFFSQTLQLLQLIRAFYKFFFQR